MNTFISSNSIGNYHEDNEDDDDDEQNDIQIQQNPDNVEFPDWPNLSASGIYETLNPPSRASKAPWRSFFKIKWESKQIKFFVF